MASLLADWNNNLGMLHRMIHTPAVFKKFSQFINPDYLYKGENEERVLGLRALFRLLLDLEKESRLRDVLGEGSKEAIYPFAAEVRKFPDGKTKDAALEIIDTLKNNKDIPRIAQSDGCMNQFIDYLKANMIAEWASAFQEPYRQGKILPATKLIKDLVSRLDKIKTKPFNTMDADGLYDKYSTVDHGLNNFYLGIKQLDELNGGKGFCQPKTLTIWMAPPGGGKSMMTTTLIAECIFARKYVNWTIIEDREETFEPRLLAAVAHVPINKIKNGMGDLTSEEIQRFKKAQKAIKEYVHVDYMYGASPEEIHERKKEVDQIRRAAGEPEYEIDGIDYTMHAVASDGNSRDKMHERLLQGYTTRKNFALNQRLVDGRGKVCHDFLQVNRGGANKTKGGAEFLEMTDIAGAFDIARIGDNIISINRSNNDIENKVARLWVAKGRDGTTSKAVIVPCEFYIGRYNMRASWFAGDEAPSDEQKEIISLLNREI